MTFWEKFVAFNLYVLGLLIVALSWDVLAIWMARRFGPRGEDVLRR